MIHATSCEECGAPGKTCESRFQELLAKEFTDPEYRRVHHLTVSAYMLQHSSKLTREGWLYERGLLKEFLKGGKTPAAVRRETRRVVDSSRRRFKIASRNGRPLFGGAAWPKTIMDVNADDPVVYCADITAWATSVLNVAGTIEM